MAADDALPQPASSPLQAIASNLAKLTAQQRVAGALLIAIAIALLAGVWMWSSQPNYSILFSNLAEKDGGAVITALQQQNVPYRVENGGTTIMVPATRANELRLMLASQGLPKGGLVGFELLETQKIGISQFNEQINYQRGLEGELSRTIQSLAAVSGARVHLAIPKQSAFLRDGQKPTASVVVSLNPGRRLEPAQIAGIAHLIASSVPELSTSQVSIVDQDGKLLTRAGSGRASGLDSSQLGYVEEVENSYIKRIESILIPILGPGNFRAQVTADIDFDTTEQTSETYKPNPPPNTAIRSQQSAENLNGPPPAAGVPGALSNQPPVPATAPLTTPPAPPDGASNTVGLPTNSTRSSTINYEVDKTIQHVKRAMGSVKRLSVAMVVNHRIEKNAKGETRSTPRTEEEMRQINDLVREAVGLNRERGDTLNLVNSAFAEAMREDVAELPLWQNPETIAWGKEALRWLLLLGVVFLVFRSVIKPLLGTIMPPPRAEPAEAADSAPTAASMAAALEAEKDSDVEIAPEILEAELAKMSFEKKVARARDIAAREPKMVAQMLKEWLGGGSSSGGH